MADSNDIERLLAEIFLLVARHESDIARLAEVQANVVSQVYESLQKCGGYDCDRAATHSSSASSGKRYMCERHLAEHLTFFKTKDGRGVARKLWKELPNVGVVRALEAYKEAYETIVPKFMQ